MNVLITGAHGFVGTHLSRYLKHWSLYGLDVIDNVNPDLVRTFHWNQVGKEKWLSDHLPACEAVVHLAGKAHDTKKNAAAQEYFDINTGLTQQIFDQFLASRARTFIFFSSVKAVADSVVGHILTEEVIPTPKGPYGESKIRAEEYIRQRSAQHPDYISGKKKVYILRPCMIHGPGNKGNLNLLYNVVRKGIPWPLGDFENRRSFTSIDNVCYVVEELLKRNIPSGIYHLGDDEPLSTNELIGLMCDTLGKKTHIWRLNKHFMETCAGIGSLLHLPLDIERLHKLTENYVVSNEKIKKALGIRRMPVDSREGLVKTIRSFEMEEVAG